MARALARSSASTVDDPPERAAADRPVGTGGPRKRFRSAPTGTILLLDAPPGTEFDTGTTIFSTLEKNLGLKLEKRDQPMPILVIDHLDRVPTEN